MVLITIFHGKSTKRPQHKNMFQNVFLTKLYLSENVSIIYADPDTLLNIRIELISKFHHRKKISEIIFVLNYACILI